jgi:PmbA protein
MAMTEKEFLDQARPLAEALIEYGKTEGAKHGVSDVRISIAAGTKQSNSVEKGQVVSVISGTSFDVNVMMYSDRGASISFTKNVRDEAQLKAAMLQNMHALKVVPGGSKTGLLEPDKVFKGPKADLDLYDHTPPTQAELISYAKDVEAAARAEKGTKAVRSVSISANDGHYLIMATNGLDISNSTTMYSAGASVIAEDTNGMQIGGESSVARHFNDMAKPKALGMAAGKDAVSKLSPTLPSTGEMPVVLDRDAAEAFFSAVFASIDGTALYRGTTFMKGQLGKQVMNSDITIEDDPTIPRGLSSAQVDGAGLEMRKITFVKNGVLESFNLTLFESRQLGMDPIGREGGETNSRVLPGKVTPEELIKDIKEGVYINGFNGGTVDVNNGQHSRQAHGFLIKDGKVTDIAVAGFVVSGNLKDMFMKAQIANDTPAMPSTRHGLAAPTTRIDGLTIAGK